MRWKRYFLFPRPFYSCRFNDSGCQESRGVHFLAKEAYSLMKIYFMLSFETLGAKVVSFYLTLKEVGQPR